MAKVASHSVSQGVRRVLAIVALGLALLVSAIVSLPEASALVNGVTPDPTPTSAVGRATVYVDGDLGCTGTLVAPDLVLTGGHCFALTTPPEPAPHPPFRGAGDDNWERPDRFYPVPTDKNWEVWAGSATSTTQVTASSDPGDWVSVVEWAKPGHADMILLRLQRPVIGNRPVEIMTALDGATNPSSWLDGKTFTVAGYGDDNASNDDPDGDGNLSYRLATHLNQRTANNATFPCRNEAHKLCVQNAGMRPGDSGGPLYWTDTSGVLRVLGANQGFTRDTDNGRYTAAFYRGGAYVEDNNDRTPLSNIGDWLNRMVKGVSGGSAFLRSDSATNPDEYVSQFTSANPAGIWPRVKRLGPGRYQAAFHGLRQTAGREQRVASVTAVGSSGAFCNLSDHLSDLNNGDRGDLVNVRCYNSNGTLADSRFSLMTDISDTDALIAVPRFSATSTSVGAGPALHGAATVTRLSTGRYRLEVPGWTSSGWRNVMVTAIGSSPVRCHVEGWGSQSAVVRCMSHAGSPVESRFTLAATAGRDSNYAWGSQPTMASYTAGFSNIASSSALPQITRVGPGLYDVSFAGRPSSAPGNVQVTAYGTTTNYCKLDSSTSTTARVRCIDTSGAPTDTRFVVRLVDPLDVGRTVSVRLNQLRATSNDACGTEMDMSGTLEFVRGASGRPTNIPYEGGHDVRTFPSSIDGVVSISERSTPGARFVEAQLSVIDDDDFWCGGDDDEVDLVPHPDHKQLKIVIDLQANTVSVEPSRFRVLGGLGTWWQDGLDGDETGRAQFTVGISPH